MTTIKLYRHAILAIAFVFGCHSAPPSEHAEHAIEPATTGISPAEQTDKNVLTIAPDMLRDLRLTTAPAELRPSGDAVTALGELRVNEDAYAEVRTSVSARVSRMLVGIGDQVTTGQPLLELQSVEAGKATADYARDRARAELSSQTLERKRGLAAERILPQRELQEAEAEAAAAKADLEAAEGALHALDIAPGEAIAGGRLTVRSPIAGTVIDRAVVQGQMVDATISLLKVAELSKLWLIAHAFERDAVRIKPGTSVKATFPALPGSNYDGTVALIGQQVDPSSRTIPVRIEVQNDRVLRPGMSASAWIPLGQAEANVVAVPTAALQRCEDGWCVFLPRAATIFEVRAVGRGRDLGGEVEVLNGLKPGDTVVVDGAFLLKAERERSKGEGEHHEH